MASTIGSAIARAYHEPTQLAHNLHKCYTVGLTSCDVMCTPLGRLDQVPGLVHRLGRMVHALGFSRGQYKSPRCSTKKENA